MRLFRPLVGVMFVALSLLACKREDPISATDPFPMPAGMEENKDLTVKPGDSFYDYCNGSWTKKTPFPATRADATFVASLL